MSNSKYKIKAGSVAGMISSFTKRRIAGQLTKTISKTFFGKKTNKKIIPKRSLKMILHAINEKNIQFTKNRNESGSILVEVFVPHPRYVFRQSMIALYVSHITEKEVRVLTTHNDPSVIKLFETLGAKKIHQVGHTFDWSSLCTDVAWTLSEISSLKNKKDVLSLKKDGINIGRGVYNTYLRRNNKTTVKIDNLLVERVLSSLGYIRTAKKIIKKYKTSYLILGQNHYTPWAEFGNISLENGAVVLSNTGSKSTTIAKYKSKSISTNTYEPSKKEVDKIKSGTKRKLVDDGLRIAKKRLGKSSSNSDQSLLEELDINTGKSHHEGEGKSKPATACIFAHVAVDAVHNGEWSLFPDYFTWLTETLKIAGTCQETRWILKPHPNEAFYDKEIGYKELLNDLGVGKNIIMYPRDASNWNLVGLVDAVITVRGSVGLEFPCVGVPAIIAGDSVYSGFGFTREPKSFAEYRRELKDISCSKGLSDADVRLARLIAGLQHGAFKIQEGMIPDSPSHREFDWNEYWTKAANNLLYKDISTDELYLALMQQLRDNNEHAWQYS